MHIGGTLTALCVGMLLVGACSAGDDATTTTTTTTTTTEAQVSSSQPAEATTTTGASGSEPSAAVDVGAVTAALRLASEEVSGEPFAVESDDHDGQDTWEVSLATGGTETTVWVSADGARVVDREPEGDLDDDDAKVSGVQVTAIGALELVAPSFTGTFEEMELEDHDSRLVWEIEIRDPGGTDIDVIVDAVSGEVRRDR